MLFFWLLIQCLFLIISSLWSQPWECQKLSLNLKSHEYNQDLVATQPRGGVRTDPQDRQLWGQNLLKIYRWRGGTSGA